MERAANRSSDRVGLLAIVLGGHWLVIEVLCGGRLLEPRRASVAPPESWIWIPAPPDIPEIKKTIEARPRTQAARPARAAPLADVAAAPAQPIQPAPATAPDWHLEAQSVAGAMAPQLSNELQEKCAVARRLAQALPPGCKKDSFAKDWQPQPQRAGFVGIFPYVRLGRCIIGLGFWGCAVQEPSPDGTLLEDFRNPDRPTSSVPDLPAQTFPQAPLPQAFK
jgi:hypothetical protein